MFGINLLPPEEKHKIGVENLNHLTNALLVRIGVLLVFGVLLLLNAWLCLFILLRDQGRLIEIRENDTKVQYIVEMEQMIKADNKRVEEVAAKQEATVLWTPILEELSRLTPTGIGLVKISYQASLGNLIITGKADTRDLFLAFKTSLEESPYFLSLESPLANLIKQEDVEFNFSLQPATVLELREGVSEE